MLNAGLAKCDQWLGISRHWNTIFEGHFKSVLDAWHHEVRRGVTNCNLSDESHISPPQQLLKGYFGGQKHHSREKKNHNNRFWSPLSFMMAAGHFLLSEYASTTFASFITWVSPSIRDWFIQKWNDLAQTIWILEFVSSFAFYWSTHKYITLVLQENTIYLVWGTSSSSSCFINK